MSEGFVVTMWPEEGILRAFGPDDPDIDDAVLVFLSEEAADEYIKTLPIIGVYKLKIDVTTGEAIPDSRELTYE